MPTIIRLDHCALYVQNLEAARNFFVKFFNAVPSSLYHNHTTDFKSYFLSFGDGARLEIMTRPGLPDQVDAQMRTGYIHLALSVGSRDEVDRLTCLLRENGYDVISGPRTTGDGCYESCITGPEGNLIEITV